MMARGLFTVGSAIAVAIAFSTDSRFTEWLASVPPPGEDDADANGGDGELASQQSGPHSALSHLVTGGVGGMLHAVVMAGVTAGSTVVHGTSMRELKDSAERSRCAHLFARR